MANEMNPMVEMKIKNRGLIKIELFPKSAPNSVCSFISLIEQNVYDNRAIKRIVKDFVIQPSYTNFDSEIADYSIVGEYSSNGFHEGKKLETGCLSLGGDGVSVSSGSSFFIVMGSEAHRLIDKFPCLGRVVEGFHILQAIEKVETKRVDVGVENVVVNEPIEPEIIEWVKVNKHGIVFNKPEKI